MVKVIISGGRGFYNYMLLKLKCDKILKEIEGEIQIVSGCAKGADALGERYAKARQLIVKRFEADWDKNGKFAGHIRNAEMAKYSDCLIAFWDGRSPGTKSMISQAEKRGLKIRVIKY